MNTRRVSVAACWATASFISLLNQDWHKLWIYSISKWLTKDGFDFYCPTSPPHGKLLSVKLTHTQSPKTGKVHSCLFRNSPHKLLCMDWKNHATGNYRKHYATHIFKINNSSLSCQRLHFSNPSRLNKEGPSPSCSAHLLLSCIHLKMASVLQQAGGWRAGSWGTHRF